jgi:tetratricopeptide (TPR) repeat protein
MVARNPYVIGVPLTDDAAFYGRREIFNFIREVLDADKQNVIVLYGQRRIGKTSVLYNGGRWLEAQGGFFPVYYDLQGKERMSLGQVLENLAQTLARRLDVDRPDAGRFDEDGRYFADEFLPRVTARLGDRRLVLLIDEFDVLGDELHASRPASETLFPYLQALIAHHRQVGFVFVVGRRIEELATHFQAIFKQAAFRRVGLLRPEDSQTLIVEPSRGMMAFRDDAVAEIQALAAGHPYFTQLLCFQTFNDVKAAGGTTVTAAAVRDAVGRAIESGHGALNWFWEGLPRAERFILSAVAHVSDESGLAGNDDLRRLLEAHRIHMSGLELKDAPDRLVEWEMLRREGPDAYQFVVELVRRWVIQVHPLASARRDIDHVSKRAVRLFENARDAHSNGELTYARDEYGRALDANPNHSGAQLGLAQVLYELGEIDEAVVQFERAHAIDEMSARDGLLRARLARAQGLEKRKPDAARREYEEALALVPGNEFARTRLGALCLARGEDALAKGDVETARSAFGEAVRHDPESEAAVHAAIAAHAEALATQGDLDRGADVFALLVELFPDRAEAKIEAAAFWMRCGDARYENADYDAAVRFYTRVLRVADGHVLATARLDAARTRLEEQRTVRTVFDQSLAAHRAGRFDAARDGWKKLIQLDVLAYDGHNIATLLSEAIQGRGPTPAGEPDALGRPPAPPRDDPERKPEPRRQARGGRPQAQVPDPRPAAKVEMPPATSPEPVREAIAPTPADPAPAAARPVSEPAPLPEAPVKPLRRKLRWPRRLAFLSVAGLGGMVFAIWPASVVGISVPTGISVQAGRTGRLNPDLEFSSDWRQRNEYAYSWDYTWRSSDEKVAMVDDGNVKGVRPGVALITAAYSSGSRRFEGTTMVTVTPWDVPPMHANLTAIKFFAGATAPKTEDRRYATEFDSKTDVPFVWVELSFDIDEKAPDRSLQDSVELRLLRATDSFVEFDRGVSLRAESKWEGLVTWFSLPSNTPATTYRVEVRHGGTVVGSERITIR